jgi:hypothetical protein
MPARRLPRLSAGGRTVGPDSAPPGRACSVGSRWRSTSATGSSAPSPPRSLRRKAREGVSPNDPWFDRALPEPHPLPGKFTLPPGGSNVRNERSGRANRVSRDLPTTLPGNSLTLISDPPGGRVNCPWLWLRCWVARTPPHHAPHFSPADLPPHPRPLAPSKQLAGGEGRQSVLRCATASTERKHMPSVFPPFLPLPILPGPYP